MWSVRPRCFHLQEVHILRAQRRCEAGASFSHVADEEVTLKSGQAPGASEVPGTWVQVWTWCVPASDLNCGKDSCFSLSQNNVVSGNLTVWLVSLHSQLLILEGS